MIHWYSVLLLAACAMTAAQAQQSEAAAGSGAKPAQKSPAARDKGRAKPAPPAASAPEGAAGGAPATAAGPQAPAAAPVAADGSAGEPVVVEATLEKCLECKATAKKRIAVLPTRVGSVAGDAGASPEALGQVVTARLETVLRARPELLVLGRSDLQGVLAEQDLATRGVSNAELAPQRGRVIPAELLLSVTLDRVDVGVQSRREATSDAAQRLARAHDLERQAISQREQAGKHEIEARQAYKEAQSMREEKQRAEQEMQRQAQAGSRSGVNLSVLQYLIAGVGEASSETSAEKALQSAKEALIDADRKVLEARQEKDRAERAASTQLLETRRTTATITVIWKAVDSMTNEVVAGDTIRLSDNYADQRRVVSAGGNSDETSAVARTQGLVNKLIDTSMDQVVERVGVSIDKVPFRGQIVRVDRGGVIVNAGKNYGVEAGDTFSVRRIDLSLIDPSTGRSLAGPGTLEGMIRVTEVGEQIAKAVVLQSAGKLSRGDVLEWVGVYKVQPVRVEVATVRAEAPSPASQLASMPAPANEPVAALAPAPQVQVATTTPEPMMVAVALKPATPAAQAIGRIVKDCGICPDMVVIPAGAFQMGSNDGEADEKPVHRVGVAGFLLGRTEVTQGQWKAVMGSNPSEFSECGDDCPVENVNWSDAQAYIKRLNEKTGQRYRLPTEAEWEYAARAGSTTRWSFGNDEAALVFHAWFGKNSARRTRAAAGKQANAFGLHDMLGNVLEWVEDAYHRDYRGAPTDGSARLTGGDGAPRVLRGGAWFNYPANVRSTIRTKLAPDERINVTGFRIARDP